MASTSSLGAQGGTSANFAATFYEAFNARLQALQSRIETTSTLDGLSDALSELSSARAELTEATDKLPPHDRGVHEASLRDCTAALTKRRSALTPKSTFAFRRKAPAKAATVPAPEAPTTPIIESGAASTSSDPTSTHLSLSNRKNEHLDVSSLPQDATLHASDLHIQDLQDCIVDLRHAAASEASFAAMQVRNVRRCVLLLSNVSGAVMMHDCEACLVVLQCAQFRMHTSKQVTIMLNLHTTASRATIEHCTQISFAAAPASLLLPASLEDASAHEAVEAKKLPVVQDFDHPGAGGSPSPSWSALQGVAREKIEKLIRAMRKDQEVQVVLEELTKVAGWER